MIVRLRRWDVEYFQRGERIRATEPIQKLDELEDRLLAEHDRLRRIVVRLLPNWPLSCYFLHWSDGTDLSAVDSRVAAGVATEEDWAGALVAESMGMSCLKCGAAFRVIASSPAVPLFSDDLRRWREHEYKHVCPVCNEEWTASVVEFIQ